MIVAKFDRRREHICKVRVSGHAMYAGYGKDIVCASVSSAVQMAANTITECFQLQADVMVDANAVTIAIPDQTDKEGIAGKILDGLYLHIAELSKEFKKNITIEITEV